MQHDHFSSILGPKLILSLLSFTAGVSLAQVCVAAPGEWEATGNLVTARDHHTAALLPNGKVLVVAGGDPGLTGSAELSRSSKRNLDSDRQPCYRSLPSYGNRQLPTGQVLVVGVMESPVLSRAPNSTIRRPGLGRLPAALPSHATNHTMTLLPDGKVLVAGGFPIPRHALASAELYDPATGTWSATGSLNIGRGWSHTATPLLADGRVLVVGGFGFSFGALRSAELYDPATGTWAGDRPARARTVQIHVATLLPDGRVLVVGGFEAGTLSRRISTTHEAEIGERPAAPNMRTLITRRPCCLTARCSLRLVMALIITTRRNSTIQPAELGE